MCSTFAVYVIIFHYVCLNNMHVAVCPLIVIYAPFSAGVSCGKSDVLSDGCVVTSSLAPTLVFWRHGNILMWCDDGCTLSGPVGESASLMDSGGECTNMCKWVCCSENLHFVICIMHGKLALHWVSSNELYYFVCIDMNRDCNVECRSLLIYHIVMLLHALWLYLPLCKL